MEAFFFIHSILNGPGTPEMPGSAKPQGGENVCHF